jgi:choline kinase
MIFFSLFSFSVSCARREASTREFATQLSALLCDELRLPGWSSLSAPTAAAGLSVVNITHALTNKIYRVTAPDKNASTVLLRLYGASSDELISRQDELRTLHCLSSLCEIGARILGTFSNGKNKISVPIIDDVVSEISSFLL